MGKFYYSFNQLYTWKENLFKGQKNVKYPLCTHNLEKCSAKSIEHKRICDFLKV